MTNPWENQPEENQPEQPSAEPEPVSTQGDRFGPWEVVGAEFTPFKDLVKDGISIVAICRDPQGHQTEYSVSLFRGRDADEVAIPGGLNEADWELQNRLRVAVTQEINEPKRQSLIAKRFE